MSTSCKDIERKREAERLRHREAIEQARRWARHMRKLRAAKERT